MRNLRNYAVRLCLVRVFGVFLFLSSESAIESTSRLAQNTFLGEVKALQVGRPKEKRDARASAV